MAVRAIKKSAVTASMIRVIQLRDRYCVERFVIVEMYQMLSANSEKCSDRKHHQHEAGLFSKGHSIVNRRKHDLAGNKQSKTS